MIRLQDIADMAGVSRTTVSNVINGNTKRVSQETIDKITAILKEQNYVPHMGSVMLSGHGSRIIGVVLGFAQAHGMYSLQDSFVGELVGTLQMEAEMKGYYVMLIGGESLRPSFLRDDRFHGYSFPGTYDPAGIPLWWYLRCSEQPHHIDFYAHWIFPFHGNLHVPWRNPYQRPYGAGRSSIY